MTVTHDPADTQRASVPRGRRLRRKLRHKLVRAEHGRRWADVFFASHPWWDWGHRLMALVGQDHGGNWSEPQPPTWWYRQVDTKRMWRTGFPIHPPSTYLVVTDYDEMRSLTAGLDEDEMYPWQAINVNQDGELHLGHRYWGGVFYGLDKDDVWLLRRYLRRWLLLDWFGARTWLWKLALNAAVERKKPFACHAAPPARSGGYSHWLCTERRNHTGPHRYNNYTWEQLAPGITGVTRRKR